MEKAFSRFHADFVKGFPFSGFDECLEKLKDMDACITTTWQQALHDKLVESTYEFYESMGTEDLGYEIVI